MKVSEAVERGSDSWWPIPTSGVVAALVLAVIFIGLDNVLQPPPVLAFRGDPGEARQLLSTITSAMLSFIGLVFSVSIVVFTLVSGQFSPRVLRTFLRDRWSQSTLALFVGTFVLALIALWAVRGPTRQGESFVPGLTITVVFLLVAACVGMFVHFVHHITQQVRAVTIIGHILNETLAAIDRRYPDGHEAHCAGAARPSTRPQHTIDSDTTGVLANVRVGALTELAREHDAVLELIPQIGDFVIAGEPIVRQYGDAQVPVARVRGALVLDPERSYRSDVGFGIRKLVDIAERALSPSINDPTTAIQSLDRIHAILYRLAGRALDVGAHRDADGALRLIEPVPSWEAYVALACDEVRHWGADSVRVHERLRGMLTHLMAVTTDQRHAPLRHQLRLLDARRETDLPDAEQRAMDAAADVPSRSHTGS